MNTSSISRRFGLAGALLLTLPGAHAGPSQGSIAVPGGFASACASEISSGVTYTPGQDLTATFNPWPGRFTCRSETFGGAGGVASADARWSSSGVDNGTVIRAEMGVIKLAADSTARNILPFPIAVSGGGGSDQMVVNLDGQAGEAGVWTLQMAVDGHLLAAGGAAQLQMNAYGNNHELSLPVTGFDPGNSDGLTTDRQRVQWAVARTGDRMIDDLVTFAVPVTIGQSFSWGVYATLKAGTAAEGGLARRRLT